MGKSTDKYLALSQLALDFILLYMKNRHNVSEVNEDDLKRLIKEEEELSEALLERMKNKDSGGTA